MGLPNDVLMEWEKSEDSFMQDLRKAYIEEGIPTVEEAAHVLGFLMNFCVGCGRLGAEKLGEKFSKRSSLFVAGLEELGFRKGWVVRTKWSKERGPLDTIISQASSRVRLYEAWTA